MKRTPLARGKALRRTPLARSSKRLQPRPLHPAEAERRAAVRAAVFGRDRRCLLAGYRGIHLPWVGPCAGEPLTPHHLRKAAQSGPYAPSNLVTLCARHNGWVEDFPERAHQLGLVIRVGESIHAAWRRMAGHELVTYGPWGEPLQSAKLPGDPRR